MSAESWKSGADDGLPKLGRKGEAWLRRKIRAQLFKKGPEGRYLPMLPSRFAHWMAGAIEGLLDLYIDNALRYVRWEDADEFRGRDFANGAWVVDTEAVKDDWQKRVDDLDRADDDEIESLDDWLKADIGGELFFRGAVGGMPLLTAEARAEASTRRNDRRLQRTCPCGERFRAKKANDVNCETCRARKRAEIAARDDRLQRRQRGAS